jgi:CRISPR-associated protein Csd1
MILTRLKEFADTQMMLPPVMYSEQKIRWLVDLDAEGNLLGHFVPWGGDSKATKRGKPTIVPYVGRTVGVKPKLLADSAEYVLGVGRADAKPERVANCHDQFQRLIQQCLEVTHEPKLQAVLQFLANWEPIQLESCLPKGFKLEKFDPSENVTFRVDGVVLADAKAELKQIEQFWADLTSGSGEPGKEADPVMTCLVTGTIAPVVQRMPVLIKGLYGGQPSGTALVSANSDPFTSYGLKNSLTSPISPDAAEKFAKALNYMLADNTHRISIGTTAFVFWTRKPSADLPVWLLDKTDPVAVRNLLESPSVGSEVHHLAEDEFYALSLTASMARSVVRDWLETTIPRVRENIKQWFLSQRIVDAYGELGRSLGLYALAASAYRDPGKEMQPTVPTALLRCAIQGDRLSDDLLVKLVCRNRVEQDVTFPRAALIKLILVSQGTIKMSEMESLNPTPPLVGVENLAYQCGRLLAELEAIQRAALGNVNASLVDRYYGAASSTPAKAFAPLMRGVQAHLSKLRKTAPGIHKLREQQLEEIMSNFVDRKFPSTLMISHQAIFALGYYQHRAANRAIAKAKAEAAKAKDN